MEDLDQHKLIAEIISANIENLFDSAKKFVSDKNNQLKAVLKRTFSKYIEGIERKYSSTKTIIYRDTPQSIKKFYEPIELANDRITLNNPQVVDLIELGKPILITGTGGSGKSTFLKYLLLNSIENNKFIPIFVELRNVEQEQLSLIEYIFKNLQLKSVDLETEYLDQALNRGNFIFLLDGFDELSLSYANDIGNEIDEISQKYSKCHFIVTSRPGQDFISWSNFIELRTQPLTLEKAVSLVQRLNFDEEIKEKFVLELNNGLYTSHKSFFENPLLLSIMLITYRDSASIPSELHNFYSLAFEALYYRHDAAKAFNRPTLTNLPVDKGKDIMSAFSLITYLKTQTSFDDHDLKEYLQKAMKLVNYECDVKDLTVDLMRAFCMLLQDGTMYQYTHRSFQEYFAACYLVSTNESKQIQLINQFSQRADTDITLQLAHGMNPKMIEEKLIIPYLTEFRNKIGYNGKITKTVFKKFATEYFDNANYYSSMNFPSLSVESKIDFFKKTYNLGITRMLIRLFKIDNHFNESTESLLPYKSVLPIGKNDESIPIKKVFTNPLLLDWFVKHSLEARILKELMNLQEKLIRKNKQSDELFDSLLE